MTGTQTWGLVLAQTSRAAQVIGWVGTAMFTALAIGAPLGGILYQMAGFAAVGGLTAIVSLVVAVACRGMTTASVLAVAQPTLPSVIGRLWVETGCMALSGFAYGAMVSFSVVLFEARGWVPSWAALTVFSCALVGSRVLFGAVPDRIGGTRAAWLSLIGLAAGMVAMALPGGLATGLIGASLSGMGYAVVYPSLTREAVLRVPPEARGTALALVSASIYMTLGLGNPLLGIMADRLGTGSVFAFSGATALVAALILGLAERPKS